MCAARDSAIMIAMPIAPIAGEPDPNGADCVACGRCCHHGPRTVHLLDTDEARLGDALLAKYTTVEAAPPHFRFVVNAGDRCGALDCSTPGKYPCAIYARRPDDCRIVEPGSPACLEARKLGHLGSSLGFRREGT
jgi:hypothetical protein